MELLNLMKVYFSEYKNAGNEVLNMLQFPNRNALWHLANPTILRVRETSAKVYYGNPTE